MNFNAASSAWRTHFLRPYGQCLVRHISASDVPIRGSGPGTNAGLPRKPSPYNVPSVVDGGRIGARSQTAIAGNAPVGMATGTLTNLHAVGYATARAQI